MRHVQSENVALLRVLGMLFQSRSPSVNTAHFCQANANDLLLMMNHDNVYLMVFVL